MQFLDIANEILIHIITLLYYFEAIENHTNNIESIQHDRTKVVG